MATKLLYLDNFDVYDCVATVLQVEVADENRSIVALDQTCFYPRGGGQDWDTGTITSDSGTMLVDEVRLDEQGIVQHIGHIKGNITAGQPVQAQVDRGRRSNNTRLHSAGHLLDMAVEGLGWDWVPGKGAHYPHMSFVEYTASELPQPEMLEQLQQKINQLMTSNYENQLLFMSVSEMAGYCRHVPDNIPTNKPSRIVLYSDNFGVPCGGTHVRQVHQIGGLTVKKVKAKKGIIRVSYAVDGIN